MNLKIQWSEIRNAVKTIAEVMKEQEFYPYRIVAVANGGITPAVMLREYIPSKPQIELIRPDKTLDKVTSSCVWEQSNSYLIIDDIFDTGRTFELMESELSEVNINRKFAFLFARGFNLPEDNDFIIANHVSHSHWLGFPWERN